MISRTPEEIDFVRCLKCGKILKCSRYDTAALLEHIQLDHPEIDVIDTDTKQKRSNNTELQRSSRQRRSSAKGGQAAGEGGKEIRQRNSKKHEHLSYENTKDEDQDREQPPQQGEDIDVTHYSVISDILEKYPEIKDCEGAPHNPHAQVAYTRRYKVMPLPPVSRSVLQQPFQRSLYRTSIEKWRPANGTIFCPKCGCNKRPLLKTKAERFTYNECSACCLLSCWPFCFLPWILPPQSNECLYCANCKTFLGLYDSYKNCIRPNRLYTSANASSSKESTEKLNPSQSVTKDGQRLQNESAAQNADSGKSNRPARIIFHGKELPPETVARLQKLKRYRSLAGADMEDLTSRTAPSAVKASRESLTDNA